MMLLSCELIFLSLKIDSRANSGIDFEAGLLPQKDGGRLPTGDLNMHDIHISLRLL